MGVGTLTLAPIFLKTINFMYITLEEAKKHLNINDDFTEDDEYILSLINVSENIVQKHIDRELSEFEELPTPLKQAMLLLIGNYYANRESVAFSSVTALPHAYEYIIALFKNYYGSSEGTSNITD